MHRRTSCAVYCVGLVAMLVKVLKSDRICREPGASQEAIDDASNKARGILERLGLTLPVEQQVLADRLVAMGDEHGFSQDELARFKAMIRRRLKTAEWSEK